MDILQAQVSTDLPEMGRRGKIQVNYTQRLQKGVLV